VTGRESPGVQGFIALDDEVKPAPCAIVGRRKRLPLHAVTVVVPYDSGSESRFRVTTERVTGPGTTAGLLVTVRRPGDVTDRLLWRHTGRGALRAGQVRANGHLALVRTGPEAGVRYAALARGSLLRVGELSLKGNTHGLAETPRR
jgi:hypothetical protein